MCVSVNHFVEENACEFLQKSGLLFWTLSEIPGSVSP